MLGIIMRRLGTPREVVLAASVLSAIGMAAGLVLLAG